MKNKIDKISKAYKKLPKSMSYGLIILILWGIGLILTKAAWTEYILLIVGAGVGYFITEVEQLFPNKKIKKILPIILSPLTLFILTSTNGSFGKSIIIFLNLRLIIQR